MNTFVFIRHGETDLAGRFCGHSDPELNAAGESQAKILAEQVAALGIDRIYSSDLRRASQTAAQLARQIGIEIETRPDLREINFGLWESLHWQDVQEQFPSEANRWMKDFPKICAPEGEAYESFTARIDAAMVSLLRHSSARITAVVTHRGVMCYVLTRFFACSEEEARMQTSSYCAVVIPTTHACNCVVLP